MNDSLWMDSGAKLWSCAMAKAVQKESALRKLTLSYPIAELNELPPSNR